MKMKIQNRYGIVAGLLAWMVLTWEPVAALQVDQLREKATSFGFIENKGQIIDQQQQGNREVLYMLMLPGNNVTLRANGFSYDTYRVAEVDSVRNTNKDLPTRGPRIRSARYKFHRVDVSFVGASPTMEIVSSEASADPIEYSTIAGVMVNHYGKVTYKNVYPGIDIEFVAQSKDGGKPMEYNFVVHPGADVSQIKLHYAGALEYNLSGKNLTCTLEHGTLTEHIPASFLEESHTPVDIRYEQIARRSDGMVVGFSSPERSLKETLIIDPEPFLDWATYYGGPRMEDNASVTVDNQENVIVAGATSSISMIATTGSSQAYFSGGVSDGFVVKFNKEGVRLWAAYYGGLGEDYFVDVAIGNDSNIYLVGTTTSSTGIFPSTTPPPTQPTQLTGSPVKEAYSGAKDVFVASFNNAGVFRWGFYYGGGGLDEANAIETDGVNYFYITGYSNSVGLYDGSMNAGVVQRNRTDGAEGYDAFIGRFFMMEGNSGKFQFGTYYGGPGNDYGVDIALDHNESVIWLLGTTRSTTGIATSGAYKTQLSGSGDDAIDLFMRKLSVNLIDVPGKTWGTYYGGAAVETASSIKVDQGSDNMYVCGTTLSTDGIATTGAWQTTKSAGNDGFILKMSPTGNPTWATYHGSSGDDQCLALAVGYNGFVYVTGSTTSPDYFSTPGSHQPDAPASATGNAFLSKFNQNGSRVWGTFYGGTGMDYASGIATHSGSNSVFIVGTTESTSGIAKGNIVYGDAIYQVSYAGSKDIFIARFMQFDPCEEAFPDPHLTVSATEVFDGKLITFAVATHGSGRSYDYYFYYGQGPSRIEEKIVTTDPTQQYKFVDQDNNHPAVGRHEIVVILHGPQKCQRKEMFTIRVKPILPLCETIVLVNPGANVQLDKFSGSYVMQLNQACAEDIAFDCVYGKVDLPKTANVVAASATTYSESWKYDYLSSAQMTGNAFERGEAGKWRARAQYVYNGGRVSVDKNYNSGTFVLPNFVWQRPDATVKAGWLNTAEFTRYSPNGDVIEERNALDIPSTAKYGYNGTLPYLVAKNAGYNAVFFESFENIYGTVLEDNTPLTGTRDKTTSHSGLYSLRLTQRFTSRAFNPDPQLLAKGLLVRVWAKGNISTGAIRLVVASDTRQANLYEADFKFVARSGEWALLEARITPGAFALDPEETFTINLDEKTTDAPWIDDIRIQPVDAEMICYVYDPGTLRVLTILDDQHFGLFYQYNMEGKLVRKMLETEKGMKTIQETQYNTPEKPNPFNTH
jgi:hypothetical protein